MGGAVMEGGRRRGAVATAVEVRRGWCSSHGGWKMRADIGVGDGGSAHNAFYKAEEGVKGRGRGRRRWIFNPHRFRH
jgi:hypothetical protein